MGKVNKFTDFSAIYHALFGKIQRLKTGTFWFTLKISGGSYAGNHITNLHVLIIKIKLSCPDRRNQTKRKVMELSV